MSSLSVLLTMLRGQPSNGSLSERLDAFYRPQAAVYDQTREHLLKGRKELIERLEVPTGGSLVDLGGGTGRCLEFFGPRLSLLSSVYLVDLSSSLLEEAKRRKERLGWENLRITQADTTTWAPGHLVDCVYISYSLTMAPNWFQVIDNALSMLRPGGLLGVVDFYVARKNPPEDQRRQGWLTRHFWPLWFEHDGVFLSAEHLPYLRYRLETLHLIEGTNDAPILPLLKMPYYIFIGRKAA